MINEQLHKEYKNELKELIQSVNYRENFIFSNNFIYLIFANCIGIHKLLNEATNNMPLQIMRYDELVGDVKILELQEKLTPHFINDFIQNKKIFFKLTHTFYDDKIDDYIHKIKFYYISEQGNETSKVVSITTPHKSFDENEIFKDVPKESDDSKYGYSFNYENLSIILNNLLNKKSVYSNFDIKNSSLDNKKITITP
ncbi:hypothetical protein GW796_00825 [archaeon]|nr:hypothetical protein [archaeon]NCQ50449.1 hypothetical protein [archaeon]